MTKQGFTLTKSTAKMYGISDAQLDLWLSVAPIGITDRDAAAFVYQCARTGLDPMARQIYSVARRGKNNETVCTVQTGIDGYRLIADRTGKYAGSDDPVFDEGLTQYQFLQAGRKSPSTATVSVYKAVGAVLAKFTATAEWSAYYPGSSQGYMWGKMPLLMLGKVSEALALRKAFPAELSGIYTSEEMMQAGDATNDEAVTAVLATMGVKNDNALHVLDKLESIGIAQDDEVIVNEIGYSVKDVPNTSEGNDLLKKVWNAAGKVAKGETWGAALFE